MLYEPFFEWLSGLKPGPASFVGSLTGFIFGLIALVLGALFNFWLNRRRDNALRREEMKAVAAALYGEILLLREQVAYVGRITATTFVAEGTERKPSRKFDEIFLEQNTLTDPILYPALASKLGMLAPDLVLAITKFHDNYQSMRHWIPRMQPNEKREFTYSVLHVLSPAWSAIHDVKPALREIERLLEIKAAAGDPKTGQMGMVIEMEEEVFNTPPPPND